MKRRPLLVLPILYGLLTLVLTFPLALHLTTYVADTGDPLLNTWALTWGQRALLTPWFTVSDLFNANAFYPYRHSLGFSEHLLLYAALTLPLHALGLGPIFAHNAAIVFSLAVAGWGMALLGTYWTGNRWAGITAGIIFAFVPARLNHWAHLHQLSIQWLPFIILTLDRWLTRGRRRDLVLFGIFLNLQLLSAVNYIPQTILLVGLFLLVGSFRPPVRLFTKEAAAGGLLILIVTLLLNWPIANIYFDLSDLHGFERSLGDATIYGAALLDYLTPPPENVVYGSWLTTRLANPTRPLIPLFIGLGPIILVSLGILSVRSKLSHHLLSGRKIIILFLILVTLIAVLLSFGANAAALGSRVAPLTQKVLLYRWLFETVPGLAGLRVPARMVVLAFFGLAGLAGFGMGQLARRFPLPSPIPVVAALLIIVEYLALPLPGTHVPTANQIPAVYHHLAADPGQKVVLELPYDLDRRGAAELPRLYYASFSWYNLANGASGFNPAGLQNLSRQMQRFPDPISLDILRQIGITHLVLHADEFTPERWQDIWSKLPTYLPAIKSVSQFGHDYLLTLQPAVCLPRPESIAIQPGRLNDQLDLSFSNTGPATFFAAPHQASQIRVQNQAQPFLMPLFIPAGETETLPHVISLPAGYDGTVMLDLPNLDFRGEVALEERMISPAPPAKVVLPETPLNITFGDDLHLLGYTLRSPDGTTCRMAFLRLYWAGEAAGQPSSRTVVRLVDRFGQTAALHENYPWQHPSVSTHDGIDVVVDEHRLPFVETAPSGRYGLVLGVFAGSGQSFAPSNTGNRLAAVDELLLSDLVVRPAAPQTELPAQPVGAFANGITLLGYQLDKLSLEPGDWLRLSLYWRANETVLDNLTVFTQLVDSDGRVWGQYDNPPRAGWYPTTLWRPGEVVGDDYLIQLDPATPATVLHLRVGLYDPNTLARLAAVDAKGNRSGDHLQLTSLNVIGFLGK